MLLDYILTSSFITNNSGEIWRCKRTFTELLSILDVDTKTLLDSSVPEEASLWYLLLAGITRLTFSVTLPVPEGLCWCIQGAVSHPISLLDEAKVLLPDTAILHRSILSFKSSFIRFVSQLVLAWDHRYQNHFYSRGSCSSLGPLPRIHYNNFCMDHWWVWIWSWTGDAILCSCHWSRS